MGLAGWGRVLVLLFGIVLGGVIIIEDGPLVVFGFLSPVHIGLAGAQFQDGRHDDADDQRGAYQYPDARIGFEEEVVYLPEIHRSAFADVSCTTVRLL